MIESKWHILLTSGQVFEVSDTLDSSRLMEAFNIEGRFLLNEMRLPIDAIAKLLDRRKMTLKLLNNATHTKASSESKKYIVKRYREWLTMAIGAENYSRLVEYSKECLRELRNVEALEVTNPEI